ncbi:MAG: hypothetical protein HRT82_17295, partial [Henriciella sp.]|nr:hypothetical protein [Henriciella sp.]
MPTPQERIEAGQELRRRGKLSPDQDAALSELERRYSVNQIQITPAQTSPTTPRPNANEIISQIDDITAADLQNQVDSRGDGNLYVTRDSTGAPIVGSLNEPSYRDYNPDATFLDYMPQGEGLQRQAVAMRGSTLALGDEVAGAFLGDDTRNALNMLTDKAYEERPWESFGIEMVSGLPAGGVMTNALGLRAGGAATGTVFGAGQGNTATERLIGGAAGGATGGLLTTSGKGAVDLGRGAVNIGRRLRRATSGQPTVATNARDEFGIRLSQGQVTNDIDQIAFEQAAARGGRSEGATQVMRPFMDDQREAVRSAGNALAGDQFQTANDAGAVFADGLRRRVGQEQQRVTEAYDAARSLNANLQSRGAQSMPQAVISGLDNDLVQQLEIDPEGFKALFPNTASALRSVTNMGQAGAREGLPFEQLENTRR